MKRLVTIVFLALLLIQIGFSPLSLLAQGNKKNPPTGGLTSEEQSYINAVKTKTKELRDLLKKRHDIIFGFDPKDYEPGCSDCLASYRFNQKLINDKIAELTKITPPDKFGEIQDHINVLEYEPKSDFIDELDKIVQDPYVPLITDVRTLWEKQQADKYLDYLTERTFDIERKMKYRANQIVETGEKDTDPDEEQEQKGAKNPLEAKVDAMVKEQMTNCMNKAIEDTFRGKGK